MFTTLKYTFETNNRAPFGGYYECEYEYDPSLKDLEKALAEILYDIYMKNDVYEIAEEYEDFLTDHFYDEAYNDYWEEYHRERD